MTPLLRFEYIMINNVSMVYPQFVIVYFKQELRN